MIRASLIVAGLVAVLAFLWWIGPESYRDCRSLRMAGEAPIMVCEDGK